MTDVLKPSGRRTALRGSIAIVPIVLGVGATTSGAGWIGIPLVLLGLFLLAMTACILVVPRSYELHVDDQGFRVHDLFGRPVHDVRWDELFTLFPALINGSVQVVGFVCRPRKPKHGRLRWRRGTEQDDGCMPDHYGLKPDVLIARMTEHRSGHRAPTGATYDLEAF